VFSGTRAVMSPLKVSTFRSGTEPALDTSRSIRPLNVCAVMSPVVPRMVTSLENACTSRAIAAGT
jgi:hypothetical protein